MRPRRSNARRRIAVTDVPAGAWLQKPSPMTDEALRALRLAGRLADDAGRETALEDLLAGVLAVTDGAAVLALERAGVPDQIMRDQAAAVEPKSEKGPHASSPVRDVLQQAMTSSLRAKHGFVGTGHFLLGFVRSEGARAALEPLGVDPDDLADIVLAAIVERPEHRSLRSEPPTHPELMRRLHRATILYQFSGRQEGPASEAAAAIGRQLWEHFREAMRLTLVARSDDKTPEDLVAAQREAIALLDTEIERAERAFSELGLELPAVDSSGGGDDPTP